MIKDIITTISDFEEQIENENVKVCMLRPYSKISLKGWSGFVKHGELMGLLGEENNLGISLVGAEYPGQPILTCIDIDGDKREFDGISLEQFSKEWMFKILTKKLESLDINYMAVQSSSGGYHIYIYCLMESSRFEATKNLLYPQNKTAASIDEDMSMFLSGHQLFGDQIYGSEVPHSIIEVWCNRRYMVAPGSLIKDDKTGEIHEVSLLPNGVQSFKEIGTYEGSLVELIRKTLIESGFKPSQNKPARSLKTKEYSPSDLSQFQVQMLGNLLLEWYPLIDGQKHNFTLALSGFLYNKQVSIESINELGDYIVSRSGDLFKSNEQFIETLVHDTKHKDKSRFQTGLPTMEDILEPFFSREKVGKQLHLLTKPTIHKFWPNGRYADQYHEIIIDFKSHYMIRNRIRTKINKDGEINHIIMHGARVLNNIDYFEYLDDISNIQPLKVWEKPVRVHFTDTKGLKDYKDFVNTIACCNGYNIIQGSLGDHSKAIVESIINEFQYLDLIPEVESSTRTGIWFSKRTGKMTRYFQKGTQIVEDIPDVPKREDLCNALEILKKLNDIIPWEPGKFGFFIRTCFTTAYSYILKYQYNNPHPSVLLYGESETLKSTIAQLGLYLHGDFSEEEKDYIVSGSEMNSEFRFANNLDKTSFPLIVEEPEQLFTSITMRELIKSSAFNKMIRQPGGPNSRPYYSNRSSILTINRLPSAAENPEYLRRFISINYNKSEVAKKEHYEKMSFLNVNGRVNYRFKELHYIGDYIFNILNMNLDWFNLSLEMLQFKIIDSLEEYSGMDLGFLRTKTKDFNFSERGEYENNTLNSILNILRRPYRYSRNKYINQRSDIGIVKDLINNSSEYYYVHFIKQKEKNAEPYVLIDIGFKESYNSHYINEGKTITLNNTIKYLEDLDIRFDCLKMTPCYIEGRKKQVRGIKMSLKDFVRVLTGKQDVS